MKQREHRPRESKKRRRRNVGGDHGCEQSVSFFFGMRRAAMKTPDSIAKPNLSCNHASSPKPRSVSSGDSLVAIVEGRSAASGGLSAETGNLSTAAEPSSCAGARDEHGGSRTEIVTTAAGGHGLDGIETRPRRAQATPRGSPPRRSAPTSRVATSRGRSPHWAGAVDSVCDGGTLRSKDRR